jgi:hypothetical protein
MGERDKDRPRVLVLGASGLNGSAIVAQLGEMDGVEVVRGARDPPTVASWKERGSYRLARLAAKYGPEIALRDLTDRFSYDCMWRAEARSKKGKSACTFQTLSISGRPTCRPEW